MGHGSRLVGEIEVVALCDGVAVSSNALDESFPGVGDWDAYRAAFPDVFTFEGDRWRFHVHAFLIRTPDATVLVDTGVGPPGAPTPEWAGEACGRLHAEFAVLGVHPGEIDAVVLTHVHDDHFGGFTDAGGAPVFSTARHMVHQADWEILHEDPEDEIYVEHCFAPVRDAGLLEVVTDGHPVTGGVTMLHTPGHTPGHSSVLVESNGERLLVAGDVLNHPGQIADRFPSGSDHDADLAARTREEVLSRVERERLVLSTAHLTEPFGLVDLDGLRRIWRPLPGSDAPSA